MHGTGQDSSPRDAFVFDGTLREFIPIALVNLLLTVVTFGIYSFWGSTRVRHYLWRRTRFIDAPLEWTGTGKELFLGFLVVMLIVFLPIYSLIYFLQGQAMRGQTALVALIFAAIYFALLYLMPVAHFRMIRYRLSRTLWHGIRGGSDDGGWRYGAYAIGRGLLLGITFFLTLPSYNIRLWNARWGAMSFGPHAFNADAMTAGLYRRFFATWLVYIIGVVIAGSAMVAIDGSGPRSGTGSVVSTLAIYLIFGLAAVLYLAVYARNAIGGLTLGDLSFQFDASTGDWIRFAAGNVALVVCTLGLGVVLLPFRNWQFLMRHLGATGNVDLGALTQSSTRAPGEGEGLAAAFEIGAI